jgi:acyl-CoA thioesterase-1
MNPPKPYFIEMLEQGVAQTLCIYGTSLSYHLAPHLRDALKNQFGDLITVINSGMSGTASRTGLAELRNRVIDHAPDTLLLEFAVNDSHTYFHSPQALDAGITLQESRANLEEMLDILNVALPSSEVILQTMNPAWDPPQSTLPATNRPELDQFYEQYREAAKARGLQILDNYSLWRTIQINDLENFERLIPDGVHPTPHAIKAVLVPHLLKKWGLT